MRNRDVKNATPSTAPKRDRKPGRPRDNELAARRRTEIVRHAINEFARRGFNGADLDVIARDAGCSKGTLYNYFASKGELFSASVNQVMLEMKAAAGVMEADDPLEQLARLVLGFLQHFADHPQHVELLVQERSDFRDVTEPGYARYRAESHKSWIERFERLIATGQMRAMPPDRAVTILGDLLYGTIFLNYFRGRRISPARQAEELLDVLLGGLLTEKSFAAFRRSQT